MAAAALKATGGKVVLSDSDEAVQTWIKTRGGELISSLSEESRRAVMNIILRGQALAEDPRRLAQEIRPLIGLNQRQAQANVTYRERVYQRFIERGLSPSKATEKADAAAMRYAGRQHRYRAETITNTELAFAYNRGAHMGVDQAIANGYMGKCEMVWSTAGTNRVCSRCMELRGKVVGTTEDSGAPVPPLHPRCRCTIMYREVEPAKALRTNKPQNRMSVENDVPQWPHRDKSKVIPKEIYVKLRSLAEQNGVTLIGVKNFDGSAEVMREIITTLIELKKNFPAVSEARHKLELEMSILLAPQDYAETTGRRIKLNAAAYRDVRMLATEYQKDVTDSWFVKGTNYRAIIHHEFGHVVANVYKLDSLKIACEITGLKPKEVIPYASEMLSKYASSFADGREIIAEVFADMSTNNPNEFSRKFYRKILELIGRMKMAKMSRKYKGCTDWMANKEWYYIDEENDRYCLSDKAPEEAQLSFKKWKKINGIKREDKVIK